MIKKVYFEPEIKVDNTSSIPLHRQISDILQNALEHNHVEEGMLFRPWEKAVALADFRKGMKVSTIALARVIAQRRFLLLLALREQKN